MTIQIDGQRGEGGGQVLRSALTLSMCTGLPLHIHNIRAGRRKPGLMRQHLAAVQAAATIANGQAEGASLGSTAIEFVPGTVRAGDYHFAIGSAGSTTLLAQTLLPVLACVDGDSVVRVEGGTHNGMAPSTDFIEQAFMPCLRAMGMTVSSTLERHGFYPNGGGSWEICIGEWQPARFELTSRGALMRQQAVVKSANIGTHIAEREVARIRKKLRLPDDCYEISHPQANGPGKIVSIRLEFEHLTEVFEAVGALGLSAERVAGRAASAAKQYLVAQHPVDVHLADQLLLPLVLGAGGVFVTGALTAHTRTNIDVIERFLGPGIVSVQACDAGNIVHVSSARSSGLIATA